ncbi:hypothetical protein HGRIS_005670 [Hohenbuehelia grisea]|uniref:Uncharacterized protein n=1 Tax=Hohenbuehelia grisea TaxID=104357 RepID=A0ABR3JXU0_9AGAR
MKFFNILALLAATGGTLARLPDYTPDLNSDLKRNDWNTACGKKCYFDLPDTKDHPGQGFMEMEAEEDGMIFDLTHAAGWTIAGCKVQGDNAPVKGKEAYKEAKSKTKLLAVVVEFSCPSGATCAESAKEESLKRIISSTIARLPQQCEKIGFAVPTEFWKNGQNFNLLLTSDLSKAKVKNVRFNLEGKSSKAHEKSPSPIHPRDFNLEDTKCESYSFWDPRFCKGFNKDIHLKYKSDIELVKGGIECSKSAPGVQMTGVTGSGFSVQGLITVSPDVDITANFGVKIKGWLGFLSVNIEEAYTYAFVDGHAGAKLGLGLELKGQIDSGEISLITIPVSPLTFGFISFGPSLELLTRVNASVVASGALEWDFKVDFSQEKFALGRNLPAGSFSPKFNPGTPQAIGDLDIGITAHVIPRFNFGIYAPGFVQGSVFVDADVSLTGKLELKAKKDLMDVPKPAVTVSSTPNPEPTAIAKSADTSKDSTKGYDYYPKSNSAKFRPGEDMRANDFDRNNQFTEESNVSNDASFDSDLDSNSIGYKREETHMATFEASLAKRDTTIGAKVELLAFVEVRIGAQVMSGKIAGMLMEALGFDWKRSRAWRLWFIPMFDMPVPLGGDQSVFTPSPFRSQSSEAEPLAQGQPSTAPAVQRRDPEADTKLLIAIPEAKESSFLPIKLGSIAGLQCEVRLTDQKETGVGLLDKIKLVGGNGKAAFNVLRNARV